MPDAYANIDCLWVIRYQEKKTFTLGKRLSFYYNSSIMVLWVYFLGLLRTSEKLEGKPGKAVMHND